MKHASTLGLVLGRCTGERTSVVDDVHAQGWQPTRVRWVVPYPPRGENDLHHAHRGGAVECSTAAAARPGPSRGVSGTLAFDLVARAAPDGYTITSAADAITILPSAFKKLTFDPRTSFAPVTNMTMQRMAHNDSSTCST